MRRFDPGPRLQLLLLRLKPNPIYSCPSCKKPDGVGLRSSPVTGTSILPADRSLLAASVTTLRLI